MYVYTSQRSVTVQLTSSACCISHTQGLTVPEQMHTYKDGLWLCTAVQETSQELRVLSPGAKEI